MMRQTYLPNATNLSSIGINYRLDLSLALSGRKFGAGMGSFARMMLKRAKRFAAAS